MRRAGFFSWAVLWAVLFVSIISSASAAQVLSEHVVAVTRTMQPLGVLAQTNTLNLAIGLPLRNPEALSNLLHEIYDPASPNYHHYLTPQEFAAQFGPAEADYQKVVAFAKANSLQVTATSDNRILLDVSGSVENIEKALHVTMLRYQHPTENRTFYAPDREPSLDLSIPVLHIGGLNNYSLPRPRFVMGPSANGQNALPRSGSGPNNGYIGNDFRSAYVPDTTLRGSGQVVGLLQFDGYNASDITYYESQAGLTNIPLENVLIDGASGNPSGQGGEVEVSLDIEMAISMAPALAKVIVYEAPNPSPFEDLLNRMATDNQAKQLSCSWYEQDGGANPTAEEIFQEMAAQGQSFFSASGDNDAYTGLIDFPGDSPNITQVGGTTLTMNDAGGSYSSETVWNWGGGSGSGGGVSTQYPIPGWQTNISMAANQGSATMRNTPDVALTADNVYVRADGFDYNLGGTSAAAPLWAGFAALVNQQAAANGQSPIGFINPAVYVIGLGSDYAECFHDITTGDNTWSSSPTKFYAVSGYDLCTGWGTPAGQKLIDALANHEPMIITPASGFTAAGGFGGPFTTASEDFSLTNAGVSSLSWMLVNTSAWLDVSSSSGTLAPGGVTDAVTVSLNTVASNLAVGTYNATIWFTNLNDEVGQSRQFILNVINPPIITTQPTNQTVIEGASAAFSVAASGGIPLSYQWRDNGTNLTDGGNIFGATTTNLVIGSVSTNDIGNYAVIVTNAAGSAISSNALLTITSSPPVIVLQPTNQTAVIGGTAIFSVAVIGSSPYSYQWNFEGTNITDATNASLTLVDVQPLQMGTYAVTITNLYGSATSSNALLTVAPCEPPPSGLVAWWPGDSNADDVVGTNNGFVMGSLGYTNGEVGQAFSIDGSIGHVSIPDAPSLDVFSNHITIECWVKVGHTNSNSSWEGIVTKGNASWRLQGREGGKTMVFTASGVVGPNDLYGQRNVNDDQWHHVAGVYDGTNMFLYIDGTLDVSQPATGLIQQNGDPVEFGNTANALGGSPFDGDIDEVSLYNRALSSNEIAAIYDAGSAGKCPVPPVIFVQPTNQSAAVGGAATFNVVASGTRSLFYQWSFGGTNIMDATNSSLTLTNVQLDQQGDYSVLVANAAGSTNSNDASLTVGYAPIVTTQPVDSTNLVGTTATFTVTADGSLPLSYQWKKNGVDIGGETYTNLTIVNVQTNDAGIYSAVVTNPFGSATSSNAALVVLAPPTIVVQPKDQTVNLSNSALFVVGALGTPPLLYQWSLNGTNIVGATNDFLLLTNVQFDQAGAYAVAVTNDYGSVISSNAVLTVLPPPLCDPPPTGLAAWWPGEGNAIDIVGTNNGSVIGSIGYTNGEVGQAFSLNGSSGYVSVPASPLLNSFSNNITVECWIKNNHTNANPTWEWVVTKGNSSWRIMCRSGGKTVTFTASGVNGPNDLYGNRNVNDGQWHHIAGVYDGTHMYLYVDGTLDVSQAATGLIQQNSQPVGIGENSESSGGVFDGLIDEVSLYHRALSSNEIAAIYNAGNAGKCLPEPPVIFEQPTNVTVLRGSDAEFDVEAGGSMPLSYQWHFNGTNIVDATNATLLLTNIQLNQAGNYAVLVTNLYGSVLSSNAALVVNPLFHFVWNTIPSPRFADTPFAVVIKAQNPTNGLATNFTDAVFLLSTNGIPVDPVISGNFIQGVWTGAVTINQTITNLVLEAKDNFNETGLANAINIVNIPSLTAAPSGSTLYITWPVNPSGFVLETTPSLSPANWVQVAAPPVKIGDQYLEPITFTDTNAFYRLRFSGP